MNDSDMAKAWERSKPVKWSGGIYRALPPMFATLTLIGLATPILAEGRDPQPVTSPIVPPAPPGEAAPENVPADSELGIPLGSFRLFPTLDLRVGYDSNVFATQNQPTGSAYEGIRPSLDVKSDWNNHMLNFGAYGAFGFYNNAASQNYQNFGFSTDGRLDIYRDWNVTMSAAFTGTTEAAGSPDVSQVQAPTVVYAVPLNLGMFQRFSRLFYQANLGATGALFRLQPAQHELAAGRQPRPQYIRRVVAGRL
jgi:hypothetical protein